MTSKPLNSFGQAFASAQQAKAEAAIRKTPIYLIVGLDFGTAYTKCMVRDYGHRATPISFQTDGAPSFFVPSELTLQKARLQHPLDRAAVRDGATLSFLKMALISAVVGERSDWLDGIMRPLEMMGSFRALEYTRALVVFYLAHVLAKVQEFVAAKWPAFGQHGQDQIFYNMAVPVAQAQDQVIQDAFRDCLEAAVSLSAKPAQIPCDLPALLTLTGQTRSRRLPNCDLLPEVTANVQSYVKSRGGREGLYLFADIGAGTVDFSVFIYYHSGGNPALSYPHAAVEMLGSSQMELRTFQRVQAGVTRQLRRLKEGDSVDGHWRLNLNEELKSTCDILRQELSDATEQMVVRTKPKIALFQFRTMQILYGGGGCCQEPYKSGIEAAFAPRWGLSATSQPLPVPNDADWPTGQGALLFRRFSVAYGLSFLPTDQPVQRFPDQIGELPREQTSARTPRAAAPSKDEV